MLDSKGLGFELAVESPNFQENDMIDKMIEKIYEADDRLENAPMDELHDRISSAAALLLENGQTDGIHHKQWVIDQALRMLLSEEAYEKLTDENWEKGLAP